MLSQQFVRSAGDPLYIWLSTCYRNDRGTHSHARCIYISVRYIYQFI